MRVILVFFDTMRHDRAGCCGYGKPTTPNVDRLASQGMLFSNCYATDTPTQPCYTATMTGKRGNTTGVVSHGQEEETVRPIGWDHAGTMTFPQVLSENGVLTAAVSTLFRFRRWFAQGFTHYLQPDISTWLQHVTADQVNRQALEWLEAYGHKRDFFLFLHYWDPHTPYRMVKREYVERFYEGRDPYDPANRSLDDLRARPLMNFFISGGAVPELRGGLTDIDYPKAQYDAEVFTADEGLGEVLALLEKLKILDDTMIVFTSDHGEALGEHGVYFDHMDAYEQVSHVPLVAWCPGRVKCGRTDALVQHIDFAPTILEAFGIEERFDFEGRSLWRLLRGQEDRHYDAVFTNHGLWSVQRAMRTAQWSLVRTFEPGMLEDRKAGWELFRRKDDGAETTDVSREDPGALAELKYAYFDWLDGNLGARPDPLRVVAAAGSAAASVKQRYAAHLEATRAAARGKFGPGDRASLDHKPKE